MNHLANRNTPYISFPGYNSKSVTGSCNIVFWEKKRIAIDMGLIQTNSLAGDYRQNRAQTKRIKPNKIDYVIITHLHADHTCGLLSAFHNGCKAKVYIPEGSISLLRIMLEDSVKIMEQDAVKLSHSKGYEISPLAELNDVFDVIDACIEVPFGVEYKIEEGISFQYYHAGHIIYSAQCLLTLQKGSIIKKIGFTGDIGGEDKSASVHKRENLPRCHILVGECTYSDPTRIHSLKKDRQFDKAMIRAVIETHQKILVPVFALQRTEDFLSVLSDMDVKIPIYLDSPLACEILRSWPERLYFMDKLNFHMIDSWEESKILQMLNEHCIILAPSGMLTAGRALSHLKSILPDRNNAVLFCGFSLDNTLATEIKNGKRWITVDKERLENNACINSLMSFSTHCNYNQLIDYYTTVECDKLFLVHSEFSNKVKFANHLQKLMIKLGRSTKVIATNMETKQYF